MTEGAEAKCYGSTEENNQRNFLLEVFSKLDLEKWGWF